MLMVPMSKSPPPIEKAAVAAEPKKLMIAMITNADEESSNTAVSDIIGAIEEAFQTVKKGLLGMGWGAC